VDSALISLRRREHPLFFLDYEELFRNFLKGAFKHRRKILRRNLEKFDIPLSSIDNAYLKFDIERNTRAEQLPISRFVDLFHYFFK
jgi:16S rRNA (adenine1518-N6/adenine1519-N6)-dimethyltransferase